MENFEREVLQRLTTIETKLDNYSVISNVAYEANNRSKENEKDISEIKEEGKYTRRTAIGTLIGTISAVITGVVLWIIGKGGGH